MDSKPQHDDRRLAVNYFTAQCLEAIAELKARGFPVPPALENGDEPRALALTTREDIGAYVALHGGGEDEARLIAKIVAALTRTPRYLEALASDLSLRVSILTGEAVGLVSEMDRHSAALLIHARALRSASKPAGGRVFDKGSDVTPASLRRRSRPSLPSRPHRRPAHSGTAARLAPPRSRGGGRRSLG